MAAAFPLILGIEMRFFTIVVLLLPSPAFAHWGHIGDVAGHGHLLGLGALIAAGLVGAWAGSKSSENEDDHEEIETEVQEA